MVAVTVILAAIIAAFVFGMAGNVKSTKVVAFTVERTAASTVGVTFQGGQDAGTISSVAATVDGDPNSALSWTGAPAVGEYNTATVGTNSRVILVATFNDGSEQVVIDKSL